MMLCSHPIVRPTSVCDPSFENCGKHLDPYTLAPHQVDHIAQLISSPFQCIAHSTTHDPHILKSPIQKSFRILELSTLILRLIRLSCCINAR